MFVVTRICMCMHVYDNYYKSYYFYTIENKCFPHVLFEVDTYIKAFSFFRKENFYVQYSF